MKPILLTLLGAAVAVFLAGCETPAVVYTNPNDPNSQVVNLHKINVQDWESASNQMVASLLNSPALAKTAHTPATLAVDRIVNKTSEANLDTDLLTKKIRIKLNESGKVVTTTTYGRHAESGMGQDTQTKKDFLSDNDHPVDRTPDYFLTGKITQDYARSGETRQVTYIFDLSLTDAQSGNAVWEDQKIIQKTGDRASMGW